jgi:hypothetical protein
LRGTARGAPQVVTSTRNRLNLSGHLFDIPDWGFAEAEARHAVAWPIRIGSVIWNALRKSEVGL